MPPFVSLRSAHNYELIAFPRNPNDNSFELQITSSATSGLCLFPIVVVQLFLPPPRVYPGYPFSIKTRPLYSTRRDWFYPCDFFPSDRVCANPPQESSFFRFNVLPTVVHFANLT